MDDLRRNAPGIKKQTFESLRNLTIEETYELADAITPKILKSLKEKSEICSCIWFLLQNSE